MLERWRVSAGIHPHLDEASFIWEIIKEKELIEASSCWWIPSLFFYSSYNSRPNILLPRSGDLWSGLDLMMNKKSERNGRTRSVNGWPQAWRHCDHSFSFFLFFFLVLDCTKCTNFIGIIILWSRTRRKRKKDMRVTPGTVSESWTAETVRRSAYKFLEMCA